MEIYAAQKIYAENLLKEAAEAMSLGKEWPNETPHKEKRLPYYPAQNDYRFHGCSFNFCELVNSVEINLLRGKLCTITDIVFSNRHRSFHHTTEYTTSHHITSHPTPHPLNHTSFCISRDTGTLHAKWHDACTGTFGQLFLHEASNSPTNEWHGLRILALKRESQLYECLLPQSLRTERESQQETERERKRDEQREKRREEKREPCEKRETDRETVQSARDAPGDARAS